MLCCSISIYFVVNVVASARVPPVPSKPSTHIPLPFTKFILSGMSTPQIESKLNSFLFLTTTVHVPRKRSIYASELSRHIKWIIAIVIATINVVLYVQCCRCCTAGIFIGKSSACAEQNDNRSQLRSYLRMSHPNNSK